MKVDPKVIQANMLLSQAVVLRAPQDVIESLRDWVMNLRGDGEEPPGDSVQVSEHVNMGMVNVRVGGKSDA